MTAHDLIRLLSHLDPDTLIGISDLDAYQLTILPAKGYRTIRVRQKIKQDKDGCIHGNTVNMFVLVNGE